MIIEILLLIAILLALRAVGRPARAEIAKPGKATKYTRPDHWYFNLETLPRVRFDLAYAGDASTREQLLHIAYPAAGDGPFPLIAFIHGGGWSSLNSENHQILYTGEACLNALARGYAVAFVDYRISAAPVMPAQLFDVQAAVRFLRANAAHLHLDPDRLALAGDSAGAHLANLAALVADDPAYGDPANPWPGVSCKVRAVVSWHAITDLSDELSELLGWFYGLDSASLTVDDIARLSRLCSPVLNVPENAAPPFFLQHGLSDSEIPYTQSCDLYNALMIRSPNPLHRLELLPGLEHAVSFFISRENTAHILDWLDEATSGA